MNSHDEHYQGMCSWHGEDLCGDCKGTVTQWVEDCRREEELAKHVNECVNCDEGTMYPTHEKSMACDKCYMDLNFDAFIRIKERAD